VRNDSPLSLPPPLAAEAGRLGLEFLAGFLEVETERHPGNVDALAELGHVYTRQGRVERGLAIDRELVRIVPESPTAHYNLACSLSLLGSKQDALSALERAIALGYSDPQFMLADEDLANLRPDPGFHALVERLEAARKRRKPKSA
jgi:tetratricopeptide (TPR) repeat protein